MFNSTLKHKIIACLVAVTVIVGGGYFMFGGQTKTTKLHKTATSGIIFKDKIGLERFELQEIKGITCYITDTNRSLSFDEQSNSAIECKQTGQIVGEFRTHEKVFKAKKSLGLKALRADLVYDPEENTFIMLTYTTKATGDNASHDITVIPILTYEGKVPVNTMPLETK